MTVLPTINRGSYWDRNASFGNHRILVETKAGRFVRARIDWRRRDLHPEQIGLKIRYTSDEIGATNGIGDGIVENIFIENIERTHCVIVFEAPADAVYEIYYLPCALTGEWYSPSTEYYSIGDMKADEGWLSEINTAAVSDAIVIGYEARTEFDSFYPMEFPMTKEEMSAFHNADEPFSLVTESRLRPIRMKYEMPVYWCDRNENDRLTFSDTAHRNEHYVFQLAVCAVKPIHDIGVIFRDENGTEIPSDHCVCFSLSGRNTEGVLYDITRSAVAREVLPLWCGIDLEKFPEHTDSLTITAEVLDKESGFSKTATICLKIDPTTLKNNGDDDLWRLSRLFWLNSDIGLGDETILPYEAIKTNAENYTMEIMGKTITPSSLGLPGSIVSHYDESVQYAEYTKELLRAPIDLIIERDDHTQYLSSDEITAKQYREIKNDSHIILHSETVRRDLKIHSKIEYESDGHIDSYITLTPSEEGNYSFTLRIPVRTDAADYFMGMAYTGGKVPSQWEYRWDVPCVGNHAWIGGVNAGIQVKLLPENHVWGNKIYDSVWKNNGKGKMIVYRHGDHVRVEGRTGEIHLSANEALVLHFHMITTPFHPIHTDRHWKEHIYHVPVWKTEHIPDLERAKSLGATIVNLHHGSPLNENINYPFHCAKKLKEHVSLAHSMDMRYKIYYTVRELSNYCAELWAFRALGDEIFVDMNEPIIIEDLFNDKRVSEDVPESSTSTLKKGGAWLCEHLVEGFNPAWHQYLESGEYDCAIRTQPSSRLHNYYLCGLHWLIKEVDIDGLYLDGIGYDRTVMKRLRRVMQSTGKLCDIDIHNSNGHNRYSPNGYFAAANMYLEHYAYADSLWLGEGFNYGIMSPEFYLIENSGIPFGLMGEMLQSGGNPYRGMVYGMTARIGWNKSVANRNIWDIWEDFGIDKAKMYGWWHSDCPVSAENDLVRVTVYQHENGAVMISLASWYPEERDFLLSVNAEQLGISDDFEFYAPNIEFLQTETVFQKYDRIHLKPGSGWIFYLKEKK